MTDSLGFRLAADGIVTFSTETSAFRTHKLANYGVQRAKDLYWGLSDDGQKQFDKDHGINDHVDVNVGDAYVMATQDDAPGFVPQPDPHTSGPWSMHWGSVVMAAGTDRVALEGYAQQGLQQDLREGGALGKSEMLQVREAIFVMYGGLDDHGDPIDASQTFHTQHGDSNSHGTHALTFKVVRE